MFIPSYRFINFEEFFQPTCLFRPTGLLILSIVYSILQDYHSEDFSNIHVYSTLQVYQFWWIFPTYLLRGCLKPNFRHIHNYLAQNWGSDGHFEVYILIGSKVMTKWKTPEKCKKTQTHQNSTWIILFFTKSHKN